MMMDLQKSHYLKIGLVDITVTLVSSSILAEPFTVVQKYIMGTVCEYVTVYFEKHDTANNGILSGFIFLNANHCLFLIDNQ